MNVPSTLLSDGVDDGSQLRVEEAIVNVPSTLHHDGVGDGPQPQVEETVVDVSTTLHQERVDEVPQLQAFESQEPPAVAEPRRTSEVPEWPGDGSDQRMQRDGGWARHVCFQAGSLGLDLQCASGQVLSVTSEGQAHRLGVKVGWTITHVDGKDYTEELLDSFIVGNSPYS